ncbi:transposase [Aneurinibacillus aneurinilyticus]|uniref:Transposase n=1 Tax=Aneurinibacillus aneurinilyticus ATCC 12856 TaxID=649747 RepID=U1WQQ0_ANEAE|nr:transposase [Aneurinibacillus aneurinilyticus]ERI10929.1 transposase [Aneurinibacillus aneurinilyticus ATCC 12856]MED0707699.1 transposase [Aneurinibacillus aneurinilyticus]MED0721944.1 transposase [Aneurinibacillus aneurinilyticus]MED0742966.1 transposase [Aneurinibacillus aneurinilyticus]
MQRKRYSLEFKQQLVQEAKEAGNTTQVARRHGIDVKLLYRWIRNSKHADWQNASPEAKAVTSYTPSPGEFRELETENDKLKKLLGEKDLEIAILRDLVKKVNPAYRTKWK